MKPRRLALAIAAIGTILSFSIVRAQNPPNRADSPFQKFWEAQSPSDAERIADEIVKSGVTFDEAMLRLKAGRTYAAQKTGILKLSNHANGVEHFYAVTVPANYDPARRYQVRFQLHGGVGGRESNQPRGTGESPLQGAEQI